MLQTPDGRPKKPELGYEQPQTGPTTNFVGNHMTQGAIDLVQLQLTRPNPIHQLKKLQQYRDNYLSPQLLSSVEGAARAVLSCAACLVFVAMHGNKWE
jgi:hypothetical protein